MVSCAKFLRGCKRLSVVVSLVLVGCSGMSSTDAQGDQSQVGEDSKQSYRLGPNDVLRIQVFGEGELTAETRVDGLGRIQFPLLGELQVKGRTIQEVEDHLTDLLRDGYLKDPKVTVFIVQHRNFYIHGEARRPGAYPYQEKLTVFKAITLAGGFTERASKGGTEVLRIVNGKEEIISVEMDDPILPDDVIIIPESFF